MTQQQLLGATYNPPAVRIREAAKRKRATISDIAKGLNLSYESVRKWFRGITEPNDYVALASFLGTSPTWLQYGELVADGENGGEWRIRHVQLADLMTGEPLDDSVISGVPVSNDAVAFIMRGDSMEPLVCDGWYCIVEPSMAPAAGDVIWYETMGGNRVCRTAVKEGDAWLLKPENPRYPIEPCDPTRIKGVIVFTGRKLKG